jgi:FkbM family methyltransferase
MKKVVKNIITRDNSLLLSFLDELVSIYINIRSNLNYDISSNGEKRLLEAIRELNFITYFDVGANAGEWSLLVRASDPQNIIHAFELIPTTFEVLKKNTHNEPNFFINNFGLSDASGSVVATYSEDDDKLASLIAGKEVHNLRWRDVECVIRTGDDYCADNSINSIDYLKIDTEGSDLRVLRGFSKQLDRGSVRLIQFEYGMTNIYSHDLLLDFSNFLESKGYMTGKLYPDGVRFKSYDPRDENFKGPNYIAVRCKDLALIDALRKF